MRFAKVMLHREYGMKLFAVEEASEDEDE